MNLFRHMVTLDIEEGIFVNGTQIYTANILITFDRTFLEGAALLILFCMGTIVLPSKCAVTRH